MIRNPFNVRYDARPPWPNGEADELRLAYVARLDVGGKRQDLICEVMSLPHWRSRNVSVSFIGDGHNERALRRIVESLKLTSVRFAGFVDDIEELWSKHHAQVFSRITKGCRFPWSKQCSAVVPAS